MKEITCDDVTEYQYYPVESCNGYMDIIDIDTDNENILRVE